MEFSADPLPRGEQLAAQVVIVGAGPAGIVTALEVADHGIDVLLIESGQWKRSPQLDNRFEPELTGPARHAVVPNAVAAPGRRYLGHLGWALRAVRPRGLRPAPVRRELPSGRSRYDEVSAYHERACEYLGCGTPVFDALELPELAQRLLTPELVNGEVRASDLERWSLPTNFGKEYEERLKRHRRLRLVTGLTCVEVVSRASAAAVSHLRCVTRAGREITVWGDEYVLATGGVEVDPAAAQLRSPSPRRDGESLRPPGALVHGPHGGRYRADPVPGRSARVDHRARARRRPRLRPAPVVDLTARHSTSTGSRTSSRGRRNP